MLATEPSERDSCGGCAHDPSYAPARTETASVRWEGQNRVSAIVFAPEPNIVVNRAEALLGGVFGNHVSIVGSTSADDRVVGIVITGAPGP